MPKLRLSRDILPVTEFRANAAQFIETVRETGEPVILTQHGRSAAVLLDVGPYESLSVRETRARGDGDRA
jgi:prevent-host-death family protein